MARAKTTTAKKAAKKKVSKPRKAAAKKTATSSTSVIDDIFDGGMPEKSKRGGKSEKDSYELPKYLQASCDLMVSSRVVAKAMDSKAKIAEAKVKEFAINRWVKEFVSNNDRPNTCTFHGKDGQFDFIQQSRISFSAKKREALTKLGIDTKPYIATGDISIDMDVVRKLELEDAVKAAIASVIPEDKLREVLTPQVSLKASFFAKMADIARASLVEGKKTPKVKEVEVRLRAMYDILKPTNNIKNAVSALSDAECFEFVEGAEIKAGDK